MNDQVIDSHTTKEHLIERVKELSCLYAISTLFQKYEEEDDSDKLLGEIAFVLKEAWRFSEDVLVVLAILDHHLMTGDLPSKTVSQKGTLSIFKKPVGYIEVHYPGTDYKKTDFLEEEQKLLDKVCHEVGTYFEKKEQLKKEALLERSAQRHDRLAILGEITAGIAHELNTPLGNILGFAEFIEEKTTQTSIKRDIKKIIEAAIFSREVVKNLMFFACEMPQNREHIDIRPIIKQALSLLSQSFKKAQVKVSLEADEAVYAPIDSVQLTQVMFNLLINAIYASPPHSSIKCILTQDVDSLYIEIIDQGKGIPAENIEKIFEPFFTTKPVGEGSGLGLSVVHGIVKSHKGSISVHQNIPQGSIFRICIPKNTSV
ncbi:sensor histidine kinase [Mesonia sp. K7]|uniref:sensor histidine kinase n=1 Tax=Mesonia sp. K7 TaxID=2218606 RepID=UPI000DAA78C2|nr:HAMP domain-containing sensor histidine kinase [Mesonia sp. K7]PZD76700.1 sensor histidine kinase [Mesonia sp. K7]